MLSVFDQVLNKPRTLGSVFHTSWCCFCWGKCVWGHLFPFVFAFFHAVSLGWLARDSLTSMREEWNSCILRAHQIEACVHLFFRAGTFNNLIISVLRHSSASQRHTNCDCSSLKKIVLLFFSRHLSSNALLIPAKFFVWTRTKTFLWHESLDVSKQSSPPLPFALRN